MDERVKKRADRRIEGRSTMKIVISPKNIALPTWLVCVCASSAFRHTEHFSVHAFDVIKEMRCAVVVGACATISRRLTKNDNLKPPLEQVPKQHSGNCYLNENRLIARQMINDWTNAKVHTRIWLWFDKPFSPRGSIIVTQFRLCEDLYRAAADWLDYIQRDVELFSGRNDALTELCS